MKIKSWFWFIVGCALIIYFLSHLRSTILILLSGGYSLSFMLGGMVASFALLCAGIYLVGWYSIEKIEKQEIKKEQ